jgi:hypothetical protein
MKITAEDVLRLLVRSAQHFLALAWEMLGEKKKIVKE